MSNKDTSEPPEWAAALIEQVQANADAISEIEANADTDTDTDTDSTSRSSFTLKPNESKQRAKQIEENKQARAKVGPNADKEGGAIGTFTLDPRKTKDEETEESDDEDEKDAGFTLDPREA